MLRESDAVMKSDTNVLRVRSKVWFVDKWRILHHPSRALFQRSSLCGRTNKTPCLQLICPEVINKFTVSRGLLVCLWWLVPSVGFVVRDSMWLRGCLALYKSIKERKSKTWSGSFFMSWMHRKLHSIFLKKMILFSPQNFSVNQGHNFQKYCQFLWVFSFESVEGVMWTWWESGTCSSINQSIDQSNQLQFIKS